MIDQNVIKRAQCPKKQEGCPHVIADVFDDNPAKCKLYGEGSDDCLYPDTADAAIGELILGFEPGSFPNMAEGAEFGAVEANRVVTVIGEERRAMESIKAQADSEIARIELRAKQQTELHEGRLERAQNYFNDQLQGFVLTETKDKKTRSVKLLNGTIGFRHNPDKLEVEDELAALEWAKAQLPEAVCVKESLDKSIAKEHIKSTGEVPDGCTLIPGSDAFYVKT